MKWKQLLNFRDPSEAKIIRDEKKYEKQKA